MVHSRLLQKLRRTFQKAERLNNRTVKTSNHWQRRKFLRLTALAGGSVVATTSFPLLKTAWGKSQPKIAIIGAGIAGLNAAYQLKKAGLTTTIYEARNRIGGRIYSVTDKVGKDLVIELGGSFINTNHEDILTLVEEFGLKLFNRVADISSSTFPAEGYYFNGRLYPEAEVAENLRLLAAQIATDAALIEEDFDRYGSQLDRLSVKQYLDKHTDKIPQPLIRTLIENTIRTEYGVEPEDSSALQLLYTLPSVEADELEIIASDETYMVEGGNSKIIEALAQKLHGQIQTKKTLVSIKNRHHSYELVFADKSLIKADYVIMAIPFSILRQIDIQIKLPPTLSQFIQTANLGKNEKILAGFNNRIWRQTNGFSGNVWSDLGFSEVWDATGRQRERNDGVLTFYFGGKQVTTIQSQPLQPLGKDLVNRFDRIIPNARSASNNKFFRTNWANDPFLKGSYSNLKPGQYTKFSQFFWIESENAEESQEVFVDNLVFAGEHLSDEFYGFMNGAAQTGRLAAKVVVKKVLNSL